MAISPTVRSLAHLRARGLVCEKVERRVPYCRITQDLFGFIDIVGLGEECGLLGVQTTTGSHLADRRAKVYALPVAALWLRAGNRIELHGWAKQGARGKRKMWTLRIEHVVLADLVGVPAETVVGDTE